MTDAFWARVRKKWDVTVRNTRAELDRIIPRPVIDRDGDYSTSVLLVGAGRSGTSWVPNAINFRQDYRYMYEPFNYQRVPEVRHWIARQYIRPDDTDPRFVEPALRIFSGQVRNRWIDAYNRRVVAHKRLIKDVLITQSTAWVRRQFPKMPIVFLMRHPCAVSLSRLRLGWASNPAELYFDQPQLVEDLIEPFRKHVFSARDDFERHLYCWCIQNYVPLRQLKPGEVHFAYYELLTTDGEAELARLGAYLGIEFDERVMAAVKKPSIQARRFPGDAGRAAVLSGDNVVDSWRKHVRPDQLKRAEEILALFGLDRVYTHESLPTAGGVEQMLAQNAR